MEYIIRQIVCEEFQLEFKARTARENTYGDKRAMLVSFRLRQEYEDPALMCWYCWDSDAKDVCFQSRDKAKTEEHVRQKGESHNCTQGVLDDYYPHLDILIWSPTNYTKVFVRERDIHHFGIGPWVKVSDHDSCWREGIGDVLRAYRNILSGIGPINGRWYETVELVENANLQVFTPDRFPGWKSINSPLPTKLAPLEQAVHLPALKRGGKE